MKKILSWLLILVFLGIAGFSGYQLYTMYKGYHKDRLTYKTIAEETGKDFEKLKSINSDFIGWLTLPGTIIDYPVVQSHDNKDYLSLKFDKTWGGAGTLFADCRTQTPFHDRNTIIYGHHMRDGSMFHDLDLFKNQSYAYKHPEFKLYTPSKDYTAKVYAFISTDENSDIYTPYADESYIELINKLASYTIGSIDKDDKLLVLSTCAYEYDGNRHLVICKLEDA